MPPEKFQWSHLYSEVVTSGLCTGCAGCVIACPHDVLGYRDDSGIYKPFHLEEGYAPDNCSHGEKGCTSCTRACPRFRAWEPAADMHLFGRVREPDELSGIWRQLLLTRAYAVGRPLVNASLRIADGRDGSRSDVEMSWTSTLPTIERQFHNDVSTAQWVINAYALVFGVLIVTALWPRRASH